MFFILSKLLAYLVMPYTVICVLLISGIIVRNVKWKKRLLLGGIIALAFFSNEFIANEAMRAWEVSPTPYASMRKYSLGIVLTGATISGIQPDDRVYFHRGADRVVHTVQLYKLGLISKILISGGTGLLLGDTEPEANKFRRVMILMGVPEDDIMIENETRNTGESAVEVKKMIGKLQYKEEDLLLITSAFHMRRSLAAYKKSGLTLQPFSTDIYSHQTSFSPDVLLIPQLDAMIKWQKLSKEWVGMIAYKFVGYI